MPQTAQLHIADADPTATPDEHPSDEVYDPIVHSRYAQADDFELGEYDYPVPGFVRELLDELGKDVEVADAKLVDAIEPTEDIDDGMLVAFPDESLMFLGKDPTAKDAMPWYAFTVEPAAPIPAPATAADALDLLKPPEVRDVVAEEGWLPDRHGEWWLLPTDMRPAGSVFTPGVASEPYGPSPLGNHVPREYGFRVSDQRFMADFRERCPSAPATLGTPAEVLEWAYRQTKKAEPPADAPQWANIREIAGEVLVRGTIRHREDDHFVENMGEQWHKAVTHRIEVYTSDAIGEGVHLDYYGT